MKSDDVIRAVASTGGLIGIEAAPGSTRTRRDHGSHDIDDLVRHVTHCAELVGVEHVAIGGDTFYGDHLALYRVGRSTPLAPDGAVPLDADYVPGAENASELPLQLAVRLLAIGWAAEDVAAVIGGNATRLLRTVTARH
jgi:membrane dipeptidase